MTKKLLSLLLIIICLMGVSCSAGSKGDVTDSTYKKPEAKKITPQSYTEGDLVYSLSVSDGNRSMTLDVTRADGVTKAQVVSPERMCNVTVICDAGGTRIVPENGETLALTDEAARGLRVFFEAMGHPLSDSEKKNEGMYCFELWGYEVTLLLSEDGYPKLVSMTKDGYTRHGEVSFPENAG